MNAFTEPAPHCHLTEHELLRFLVGRWSLRELEELARRALAHLCALCPECDAANRAFEQSRARRRRRRRASYSAVLDSAECRVPELVRCHQEEVEAAEKDLRLLLSHRSESALKLVTERRRRQVPGPHGWRMRSPVLVSLLLEKARPALRRSPSEALRLVKLADVIVQRVPRPAYGEGFVERLATRVMADQANVLRVLGELLGADILWRVIHERLGRWPAEDEEEEAHLLSLEASLRQDQRRFGEAARLLGQAERRYRRLGDVEGIAKTLMKRAIVARLQGTPETTVELLRQAAAELRPQGFPRLDLSIQHNLALALCDLREHAAAAEIVEENRPRYLAAGDPEAERLLAWIEGRIACGLGADERAEQRLLQARNGYVTRRQGYSAALVTLDLAAFYLDRGRPREVKPLAEQMVPIFHAQDVHRELIAALMIFQQAARADRLTAELLVCLRRYLLVAKNDPRFRFENGEHAEVDAGPAAPPVRFRPRSL